MAAYAELIVTSTRQGLEQTLANWQLTVVDSYEVMSLLAADIVQETLEQHPGCAFTLPTGGTPVGMYEELVRRAQAGTLQFGNAQFFCLDDYLGRDRDDPYSLTGWLERIFLHPAGFPQDQVHFVPTMADDPIAAGAAYDQEVVDAGGLELAVLGLGGNGHIGFNEPGSTVDSRTRVIHLTEESRLANEAYYDGKTTIPDKAMSMGVATLLEARRIVLIANGAGKAGMVRAALEGPQTPDVPGSFLQLAGDRLEVILDHEAASGLTAP